MGRYDNNYTWGLTPGPRGIEARLHVAVGTRVHVKRELLRPGLCPRGQVSWQGGQVSRKGKGRASALQRKVAELEHWD